MRLTNFSWGWTALWGGPTSQITPFPFCWDGGCSTGLCLSLTVSLSLLPGSLPLFLFPGVGWQQTEAVCSTTLALFSLLKTSQNMLLNFLLPSLNPTFLKGKIRGNGQKNSLAELSSHIIDNYWPCGNKKGRAEKSCVGSMYSKWRSETGFGNRSRKRSTKITGWVSKCWETQGEGDTELTLECREGEEKNKILPWSFICIPVKEKKKHEWFPSVCWFAYLASEPVLNLKTVNLVGVQYYCNLHGCKWK